MPKVITSQGLTEFVQSGKVETIKPGEKPKEPEKQPEKAVEAPPVKVEEPAKEPEKVAATSEEGLEAEDAEFPERVRKRIGQKHRQMKEAEEAAAESERFAENQYNRAQLAEQRAEELERQNKEMQAKLTPAAKEPELKAPERKDFTDANGQIDWDKYTDAKADYAAKKAVADERERQARERVAQENAETRKRIAANVAEARKAHKDFDEVMSQQNEILPAHVIGFMAESDQTAELGYYLATHPEDRERIVKLKPIKAIAELGKLEAKLGKTQSAPPTGQSAPNSAASPPSPEKGGAPPPITPLSGQGSASVNIDPAKMSFRELREYERQRAREKRQRH